MSLSLADQAALKVNMGGIPDWRAAGIMRVRHFAV